MEKNSSINIEQEYYQSLSTFLHHDASLPRNFDSVTIPPNCFTLSSSILTQTNISDKTRHRNMESSIGFMTVFAVSGSVVLLVAQLHKRLLSYHMEKFELQLGTSTLSHMFAKLHWCACSKFIIQVSDFFFFWNV